MTTEIPPAIPASEVTAWSDEVDVLVLGFGMAGGCAAVEAAEHGARTLVLERAAVVGGTSAMAGGHFYLGGGTAVQQATGHEDSAEEMFKYLLSVTPEPEPDKLRDYCEGSVEHFAWLEGLGFEFERSYYPEKAVIQPATEGLMYTGNEKCWPHFEIAKPAPRGHKVPVPGDTQGAALVMGLLEKRAAELGVEVRLETGGTQLVVDGRRVVGVRWRRFEETGFIRASSVILACGGFVMNPDMVEAFTPRLAQKPWTLGSTYDDGLGIRMGQSVGGQALHMTEAFLTAPIYPPARLLTGILVNKHGKRFVSEDSYHARTSAYVMDQPDQTAFLIVDSEHMERPTLPLCPFIDGWETVAEMESALGIPEGALQQTLDEYNGNARLGHDPVLHKQPPFVEPQDCGPWGAYDLSLGKAMYAGFTLGGLRTSRFGQVLREDGTAVSGLYAAGACAANIAQDGKGYSSGTQLGEGSFFGRAAGRHAAEATR
jgi:3-oxo-5alpha-steroid 4-dehydrogenase